MHRQLAGFDPITAARLAPNDSQRIQRAIEIYRITRKPMSELPAQRPKQQNENYRYVTISLEPSDRLALHARIADRYRALIGTGMGDGVAPLPPRPDLPHGLPSARSAGASHPRND